MGQFVLNNGAQHTGNMGKGQNEGGFSEEQLTMYKECFKLMDINKDGTLDKNDLRGAFDNVGKLMEENELDDMLGESGGACTFDNMVQMFQSKMAGDGNDPDDLIVQAFKAYEFEGKIDEDNMIKSKDVIGLFVAQKEEEKKEEAPVEEAPAEAEPEEDEGAAKKKKKKKKKAAK